ncbi:metallophosphoesterase [Chitinophaga sp.]|uniref:metallophosphoesterase n=1 Tax=Chitinophaga sp. TaxID=1869181 RepID=UPI0026265EA0|nr:metallophosphoesterase [uncultured Chitinophaga sp.]
MPNIIRYAVFLILLLGTLRSEGQVIRFGVIADIQYADADTRGTRLYRNSVQKLKAAITDLNKQKMPFLINLGDVVDRNPADFAPVLQEIRKFRRPVYTTTGNHDYHGIQSNDSLYRLLKMPAEYYAFRKGNWRFIMLNTNEVAAYANVKGTPREQELQEMMEQIKARKGRNGAEYNGGISSTQMKWLQGLLAEAQEKGEMVLVLSHHPLGCAEGLTALNDQEIVSLLAKYSCVKALISGHHHAGAFCMVGKLPCIVLEGMVETDENSYGTIALHPDKLVITGTGRMTSRTIHF